MNYTATIGKLAIECAHGPQDDGDVGIVLEWYLLQYARGQQLHGTGRRSKFLMKV